MEEIKQEKKINKNIVFSVVAVILLVVVVLGATVAYFSAQAQTEIMTVKTGSLTMGFTSGNIVNADWIQPIEDLDVPTKATILPFSVTNTGDQDMNLTISLTDITISDELKDVDFRWGLYNANTKNGLAFGTFADLTGKSMVIYRDTIIEAANPDITKNYILRIWIHEDNTNQNYMQGKSFSAKVTVDGDAVEYTPESCFSVNNYLGENSRVEISDYDESCGTDVVIPKKINGKTVVAIDGGSATDDDDEDDENVCGDIYGAFNDKGLTSIIIPDTITSISYGSNSGCYGDWIGYDTPAFYGNNLTYLTIPESVKQIDENTFVNAGIETLFLPESVEYIGQDSFDDNNITRIILPSSIDNDGGFGRNVDVIKLQVSDKTGGDDEEGYY